MESFQVENDSGRESERGRERERNRRTRAHTLPSSTFTAVASHLTRSLFFSPLRKQAEDALDPAGFV